MRTIILTAALLCSASAFAQTTESSTSPDASMTTQSTTTTTTATDSSMNAQTDTSAAATTTASAAPATETGPTTKVLAKGDHYTVHRVNADGTVQVKVLTGDDAKLAMAGKNPPALAAFMSSQPITAGAGTSSTMDQSSAMPAQSSTMPAQSTTTTTTEQTTTETTPAEEPKQ